MSPGPTLGPTEAGGAPSYPPGSLLLLGCGKMGGALLRGWLRKGVPPAAILVVDPAALGSAEAGTQGVRVFPGLADLPEDCAPALILLAVKPQMMDAVLPGLRRFVRPETVFLSIAAGKTVGFFRRALGAEAAVARAMPNLPAAIGSGMTVVYRDPTLSAAQLDLCRRLLEAVGEVAFVDAEGQLDPVTAVSGGGPAYLFLLIECLAEAGRESGLPAELAMHLARATVCGAGALAARSPESAAALRQAVTSPKGTTLEALNVLMAPDGLQPLLTRAVAAAARRSRELAE